jgi:AraC-like DNA-binding protein
MKVNVFKPRNAGLREIVDCIYILRCEGNKPERYLSFPSVFTNFSILRNAKAESSRYSIRITESTGAMTALIRMNLLKPCLVEYKGELEEITIFLKPFGIEYFPVLRRQVMEPDRFLPFSLDRLTEQRFEAIFNEPDDEQRARQIEDWLSENYMPFDHPFLTRVVALLETQPSLSTESLARQFSVSRKTLHRHFEKYLDLSPTLFRRMNRFRRSIRESQSDQNMQNLTTLAYAVDFFDQSHMIRDFKALTGFMPKEFFRNVTGRDGGSVAWIYQ